MTKKDYILIAEAIKHSSSNAQGNLSEECAIQYVACNIADVLEKENTRFNRSRFLIACGV